jgi:hypothetical protein
MIMRDSQYLILMSCMSRFKTLFFIGVAVLASGFNSTVEARMSALEIELPSVQGWQIKAVRRGDSVMCSARQKEENGNRMTVLADTGKYRGGVWFLEVVSRNQHLEPSIEEAVASLFLNGKHVATGKALAVGDRVGNKRTATYVRFDFPAIDSYVNDIKAARVVEIQTQDLNPLKIESLSPIITAIEKCRQESLNPEFWKDAKDVCN